MRNTRKNPRRGHFLNFQNKYMRTCYIYIYAHRKWKNGTVILFSFFLSSVRTRYIYLHTYLQKMAKWNICLFSFFLSCFRFSFLSFSLSFQTRPAKISSTVFMHDHDPISLMVSLTDYHEKMCIIPFANTGDANLTAQVRSLIRVFLVCIAKSLDPENVRTLDTVSSRE